MEISKKKQLEAVKENGYAIEFIKNPDKDVYDCAMKEIFKLEK